MSVVKIAGTALGGGPWLSFALDAFDTTFQVAAGNMDIGDGLLNVAKGAATVAVGNFTSGLGDTWKAGWTKGLGSFGGAALAKAASYGINEAANIAIDGFNMKNGWHMDKNVFQDRIKGSAFKSVSSGVAAGISHSIISSAGGDYKKMANGKYGYDLRVGNLNQTWSGLKNIEKLGNLAGGLTEQTMNGLAGYGVNLNVANLGMFGGPDMGFLELHFGKGMKTSMNFGTGGLDVSANAWSSAMKGAEDISFLNKFNNKDSGIHRSMDKVDVVNLMGYSKDKTALATSRAIINGELDMMFASEYSKLTGREGGLSLAKNQGFNDRKRGAFALSDKLVSGSLGDMSLGAVIGSHEGAHLGYGPITESQGLDKLYDVDVNVWKGLKKAFKGLKNTELDTMTMMKEFSKASGNKEMFYKYISDNYDTKDETARRLLMDGYSGLNNKHSLSENQRYVGSSMNTIVEFFKKRKNGTIKGKSLGGTESDLKRMEAIANKVREGRKTHFLVFKSGPTAKESVGLIGDFAKLSGKMIGNNNGLRSAMYNLTYEHLGAFSKDLVNEVGKSKAMVEFGKALVNLHLGYGMGTKYDRTGNPNWTEFGNSANFAQTPKYSSKRASIDCNGFMNDLLYLAGEDYNAYNAPIQNLIFGKGDKQYGREELKLTDKDMQDLRNLASQSPERRLELITKINQPGVLMGWPGSGAGGHIWMMTGEWDKNNNPMIIDSSGKWGTKKRTMPNWYFRKNHIARRIY